MRIFFLWVRDRLAQFALFGLIFAVLALIFSLYQLPPEVIAYPLVLCAVIAIVFCWADFSSFARRHGALDAVIRAMPDVSAQLPKADGLIETDYAELADALRRENAALRAASAVRREDMDDYYTLWAHQIKTPIAAMRLLLQSCGGSIGPDEEGELEAELFRTEQYVELAMSYQRLEGDGSDFVLARHSLDAIVRQAVRKYARQFIRRGLSLNYEAVNMTVLTDEKWLQFVIEQILSNALKYTKEGGISIYARSSCELVIADTGIGIAPEDLPRIFEKGFTGYNGRTDKKSTGIGLYLCRRILKKLGHTVSVESVPGSGTGVILGLAYNDLVVE